MPSVIRMPKEQVHQSRRHHRNGFNIGCFRVCTCIHLGFLTSKSGMLKLFELLLGSCCETLLINFGMRELSATAFHSFLTTVTASLCTTFILVLCYTLSSRSYSLIRQSLFVRLSIKTFFVKCQVVTKTSVDILFVRSCCSTEWLVSFTRVLPVTWASCRKCRLTETSYFSPWTTLIQRWRAFM